jgi:hypothetical protein
MAAFNAVRFRVKPSASKNMRMRLEAAVGAGGRDGGMRGATD